MPGPITENSTIAIVAGIIPGLGWLIARAVNHSNRLVKLETIVADLADARKAQADILPRLEETMRNLTEVCRQIVPRSEWELANRLHEERMDRLEREGQ